MRFLTIVLGGDVHIGFQFHTSPVFSFLNPVSLAFQPIRVHRIGTVLKAVISSEGYKPLSFSHLFISGPNFANIKKLV
jgi:hypothetical protein